MSAANMVAAMNSALRRDHIDDQVTTVGQFIPKGTTGSMFAGGLVGDELGGALGPAGDAVGTVGGSLAGARGAARARGLPTHLLVGVSARGCTASPAARAVARRTSWSSGCRGPDSLRRCSNASTSGS